MNNVVLIGRIATELELKGADNKVVNFNLAVPRQKKDEVDFIPVAVFGKQAESLCMYQGKGSQIAINGVLRQDSYTTEAVDKKNTFKVIANRVQFLGSKAKETNTEVVNNFTEDNNFQPIDDEDIPF